MDFLSFLKNPDVLESYDDVVSIYDDKTSFPPTEAPPSVSNRPQYRRGEILYVLLSIKKKQNYIYDFQK